MSLMGTGGTGLEYIMDVPFRYTNDPKLKNSLRSVRGPCILVIQKMIVMSLFYTVREFI